jgi:hypothetical protein
MDQKTFKQISNLATKVKQDLRKKGLVVPRDNGDGTITVDGYTIIKDKAGWYKIVDRFSESVVEQINLAETAAVLANQLALGRWLDNYILSQDRAYGYSLFEEILTTKHAESSIKRDDIDQASVSLTKASIAKHKKLSAKRAILSSFDKLRKLR